MGALCGKESKDDNFTGPGRRLDSPPAERTTAPLPSNKRVVGGPPRTLGGPSAASGGGASGADAADARRKAAEAAEVRESDPSSSTMFAPAVLLRKLTVLFRQERKLQKAGPRASWVVSCSSRRSRP